MRVFYGHLSRNLGQSMKITNLVRDPRLSAQIYFQSPIKEYMQLMCMKHDICDAVFSIREHTGSMLGGDDEAL